MPPSPASEQLLLDGYIRVSTAREDMISPEIQKSAQLAWAARNNAVIANWIIDLDATGRNFRRKIEMGIKAVESGQVHGILVYRYDRWGRNALNALANVARVEEVGGRVISATEPLDPETAIGRYNRTNALGLAELQSDIISENWKAALANRTGRGLPPTGGRRFGYVWLGRVPDPTRANRFRRDLADTAGERYEPDPVTGPILAELLRRYAGGEGVTKLIRWLNEDAGIRTSRGGMWTAQTLQCVIQSGFAAGKVRVHDPRCKCRSSGRCTRVTYHQGTHPPLIDEATWRACLDRLTARKAVAPKARDAVYPLSGLLICGGCEHPLAAAAYKGVNGYLFRCNYFNQHAGCQEGAAINRVAAETRVLEELARWAADIEVQQVITDTRSRIVERAAADTARLQAEEAKITRGLSRLVTQRALDDSIPEEVWERSRQDLVTRLDDIRGRLAAAESDGKANAGEYLPVVLGLLSDWDLLPANRRRDILATLISRVMVYRTARNTPRRVEVIPVWAETESRESRRRKAPAAD